MAASVGNPAQRHGHTILADISIEIPHILGSSSAAGSFSNIGCITYFLLRKGVISKLANPDYGQRGYDHYWQYNQAGCR